MKKKKLLFTLAAVSSIVITCAALFFFGPTFHFGRGMSIVDSTVLTDGSVLVLTQEPNLGLLEPFTVRVFRLYPNRSAERTLVGFEESYWWRGRLKPKDSHRIYLTALGIRQCSYDTSDGKVSWLDRSYVDQEAASVNYEVLVGDLKRAGFRPMLAAR